MSGIWSSEQVQKLQVKSYRLVTQSRQIEFLLFLLIYEVVYSTSSWGVGNVMPDAMSRSGLGEVLIFSNYSPFCSGLRLHHLIWIAKSC